jgi:hypothetical protein
MAVSTASFDAPCLRSASPVASFDSARATSRCSLGHVFVLEQLGLGEGPVEDLLHVLAEVLSGDRRARHDRQLLDGGVGLLGQHVHVRADAAQDGNDDAAFVLQKRLEQVRRLDALMIVRGCQLHCLLDSLLRLEGKLLQIHLSLRCHYVSIRWPRPAARCNDENRAGEGSRDNVALHLRTAARLLIGPLLATCMLEHNDCSPRHRQAHLDRRAIR